LSVSYTLNVRASVAITINRRLSGRRINERCVKKTALNERRRRCTRTIGVAAAIMLSGHPRANGSNFTGRIGNRTLAPGSYELIATPSNGGAHGTPRTVAFLITG